MRCRAAFLGFCLLSIAAFSKEPEPRYSKEGPHNFGVLVHNSKHTIYRSEGLGSEGLRKVAKYLKEKNLPFPKTIIHMNTDGYKRSFFHPTLFAIEEYQAQEKYGFDFFHSFRQGQYTYLSGRNPYEASKNVNLSKYLNEEALSLFGFDENQNVDGSMEAFYRILDLVLESEEPVLFHCTGGRHRTGMIAMAIRYLQGGPWVEGRHKTVFYSGTLNHAQYEYTLHNPFMIRPENFDFIEQWAKDPMFEKYQNTFQNSLNLSAFE